MPGVLPSSYNGSSAVRFATLCAAAAAAAGLTEFRFPPTCQQTLRLAILSRSFTSLKTVTISSIFGKNYKMLIILRRKVSVYQLRVQGGPKRSGNARF